MKKLTVEEFIKKHNVKCGDMFYIQYIGIKYVYSYLDFHDEYYRFRYVCSVGKKRINQTAGMLNAGRLAECDLKPIKKIIIK